MVEQQIAFLTVQNQYPRPPTGDTAHGVGVDIRVV